MSISELINEIISDWAYRVNDGMPNPKNPMHVKELENVLSEMGLGHIKSELLKSINEAEEGGFTNPALNKKVRYKNANGEDKEGIVGNLLRQPEDSPGRKAAEAALPPEGSPERDAMNQELGSEKDGKAKAPEDGKGKEGEEGGGADAEAEKKKKAAAMFDPKADPAMAARLDREKEASAKLAQKDKEDAGNEKDSVQAQDDKLTNYINKDFDESPDKDFEGMSDDEVQSKELDARNKFTDVMKEKGEDSPEAKAAKADWAKHMTEKSKRRGDNENAAMWDSIRQDNDPTYKPKAKVADTTPKADDTKPEEPTGPDAGPNAEPPMDEPARPDTTPSPDQDVPDANSPNDTEVPPVEKIKNTKVDIQNAENRLKKLERMKKDHPEQFATPEKKAEWEKNKEILASKKTELDNLERQQKYEAEQKKKLTEPVAAELKNRKDSEGNDLDIETTDNGSMIIGVEHGEGSESTKQTISNIQKLPKDTKVMFVGEGGMTKDNEGNLELSGEQSEIRDAVKGHFDNAEESSWDENANVNDENSPVFKEIEKELGSKSKSKAAIWSNMVGQGDDMNADDYLDDEGKAWIVDQAKKAGATNITDKTDFNNLTDAEKKDLYELNYNDEGKMGDNEIMKGQQAYNGFRQKELDTKIKEAESKGYTVIAPVGNDHVDMWRQRNKPQQKPEEQPTDNKPEDKPKEKPAEEPTKPEETPKATKDDIKKEKPGKEAKTDSGGSLYSIGGGYYSDKPNGPAKYVRTESVIEMAFDNSLNEDIFALFEKTITGTLQNGEKITVQELPPRAVKKATQRAKAAAASSKEEPAQPASTSTEKPAEQPKAKTGFEPIPDEDVKKEIPKADPVVFGGESDIPDGIDREDLHKFNTDINKVKQIVDDAKANGKEMPDINLCDVTVPGTNLYCDENLGIKRKAMPQFKGKPVPGSRAEKMPLNKDGEVDTEPVFREMLKEKGITTTQTEVPADQLKATQSELGGDKVIGMMGALEKDPQHPSITGPIYVSRDGYVIDGHHRWAAIVAYNAQHPDAQIPMKCEVIDMDIKEAIPMCNKFAEDIGIAAKKQGETTGTAGVEQPKPATSMPPEAPADATPEKKSWFQRQKDKVLHGIRNWTKSEKEFFDRGGHKPGSEPRRNFGKMLLDKVKGVGKAIVHGLKHEYEIFKTAGQSVYEAATNRGRLGVIKREDGSKFHWKDVVAKGPDGKYEYEEYPDYEVDSHGHAKKGPDGNYIQKVDSEGKPKTKKRPKVDPNATDEEKKLFLKSYNDSKYKQKCMMKAGKAILITGLTAAATGGLAHGGVAFLKHVAVELVPHVTAETVAIGTGKAALFAGAAEMDMQKHLEKWGADFMKKMADTMANEKIPIDVMARAVESYNKEKENTQQKSEMKIESLIKEIISEVKSEAKGETFTAIKKDTGMTSVFKSKEARDAAVKDGTHKMAKDDKEAPTKVAGSGMTYRQTPDMKKAKTEPPQKVKEVPNEEENPVGQYDENDKYQKAVVSAKNDNQMYSALDKMGDEEARLMYDEVKAGAGGPVASTGETMCTEAQTDLIQGRYNQKEQRSSDKYKAIHKNLITTLKGTDKKRIKTIQRELDNICDKLGYYDSKGNPDYDAAIAMMAEAELYTANNMPAFKKTKVSKEKFKKDEDRTAWMKTSFYSSYSLLNNGPDDWDRKKGNGRVMKANSRTDGAVKKVLDDKLAKAVAAKDKKAIAHYQNEIKSWEKFKGYHDTYMVYTNKDGHTSVYHISNKKSDELDDPQNNTTPDKRLNTFSEAAKQANLPPKAALRVGKAQVVAMQGAADIDNVAKSAYSDIDESGLKLMASLSNRLPARSESDVKGEYLTDLKNDKLIKKALGSRYDKATPEEIIGAAMKIVNDPNTDVSKLSGHFTKFIIKQGQLAQSIFSKAQSGMDAATISAKMRGIYSEKEIKAILASPIMKKLSEVKAQHAAGLAGVHQGFIEELHKADGTKIGDNKPNGPAVETYVRGTLKSLHIDTYVTNFDGKVQIEMGGVGCVPADVRGCMASLSGFKGDINSEKGRAALIDHLSKNVKVDSDSDAVYLVGDNGQRTYIASDTWRQAGSSKKIATGFGSNLRKCLKKSVSGRLSNKKAKK